MSFALLGALRIQVDGDEVVLPSSKPSLILAALLAHANQTVSQRYLRKVLWDEQSKASGNAAIQAAVLRLRRLLCKYGMSGSDDKGIETVSGGYRISVNAGSLDLLAFRELVHIAGLRRAPGDELRLLRSALSRWKGKPFANLESIELRNWAAALLEEHSAVVIRCNQIELSLGEHGSIIPSLRDWTREQPAHEIFAAQLMEALYESGRQSDALAEFERIQRHLGNNYGIDPGRELQQLHLSILRGENLERSVSRVAVVTGESARRPPPVPPSIPDFQGRSHEIELLLERLGAGSHVLISGTAGVGKTALAIHVAWLLRSMSQRHPELRWLRPDGPDADLENLPHSSIVVLDDLRDLSQAMPALSVNRGARIIMTSRVNFAALAVGRGVTLCRLGSFERGESIRLLGSVLGQGRVRAEPEAAGALAEMCGDHPLALRLAATKLSLLPARPLSGLVEDLTESGPDALNIGGRFGASIAACFEDYLCSFEPACAAALRSLAATRSDGLTTAECVGVLGESRDRTRALLDTLVEASALERDDAGLYRIPAFLQFYLHSRYQNCSSAVSS